MTATQPTDINPWRALSALLLGFFMILVDSTIVSVATPAIITGLKTDINGVVWVTSGYLLAYAVPLLITGRLGDRFGPKRVYQAGLIVFTLSSLWCGLTDSIEMLIAARVVQGLGAALLTPQTMAIITRIFPAQRRGKAMGLWGATAGVATLVGPILGGLLVDNYGWEWIFYINLPVGVIALVLAQLMVPDLPGRSHAFDWLGVLLSAVGLLCIVFAIEEGEKYNWSTITGFVTVPLLIVFGVVVMAGFVWWQKVNRSEPLMPLVLFENRNFSLANVAITAVGLAITSMAIPLMIWAQTIRGWSPTQSALLLAPMAIVTALLAPFVGPLVDRMHPRNLAGFGLTAFSVALAWIGALLDTHTSVAALMPPIVLLGVANGFMWSPLSVTATRTLPPQRAGAGSGVYNAVRQVGAVIGTAAIASLMESRLTAHLGEQASGAGSQGGSTLPPQVIEKIGHGFSRAMGEALYLPAVAILVGVVAVLFFTNPHGKTQDA